MLTLARALKALDEVWNTKPAEIALTWNTAVQFDGALVSQLVSEYTRLSHRFGTLARQLPADAQVAARSVLDCADELHRLRHCEALRLYPLIAHSLAGDPVARRLFWQSRLVMLGLARRAFRRLDEVARAIRGGSGVATAIEHAAKALAEYRQRNEAEIYPLYALSGRRRGLAASSAA